MMKRAELDTKNPPGQIVNQPVYEPKRGTLGEYIDKALKHEAMLDRTSGKKKLTFEEWYSQSGWAARHLNVSLDDADSSKFIMNEAWKAAQENV